MSKEKQIVGLEVNLEAAIFETKELVQNLIKALEAVKNEVVSNQEEIQDFVKAWKDEVVQRLKVLKARQQTITDNQEILLAAIRGEKKVDKEKEENTQ